MKNVSELIKSILQEGKCEFSLDDCLNMDLYYEGVVNKEDLSSLITLASEHKELEPLLCQIVGKYTNADSVDLNNFNVLLNYKGECRRTLLWNLCEVPLSFYQMQILFDKFCKDFPEIACNMLSTVYQNDCFSAYDMEHCLNKLTGVNIKSIMSISELIASVPTNSKTKLLKKYL